MDIYKFNNRIQPLDSQIQDMYQALFDIYMINKIPDKIIINSNLPIINSNMYDYCYNSITKIKNKINILLVVFNKNNIVGIDGNEILGVDYWDSNQSGIGQLDNAYDYILSNLENVVSKAIQAMRFNGLMKGN